jgi:hypothetical protein
MEHPLRDRRSRTHLFPPGSQPHRALLSQRRNPGEQPCPTIQCTKAQIERRYTMLRLWWNKGVSSYSQPSSTESSRRCVADVGLRRAIRWSPWALPSHRCFGNLCRATLKLLGTTSRPQWRHERGSMEAARFPSRFLCPPDTGRQTRSSVGWGLRGDLRHDTPHIFIPELAVRRPSSRVHGGFLPKDAMFVTWRRWFRHGGPTCQPENRARGRPPDWLTKRAPSGSDSLRARLQSTRKGKLGWLKFGQGRGKASPFYVFFIFFLQFKFEFQSILKLKIRFQCSNKKLRHEIHIFYLFVNYFYLYYLLSQ